jgi:hypothetical protein
MRQCTASRRSPIRPALTGALVAAALFGQMAPGGTFMASSAHAQEQVRAEVGRPLQAARDLIKAQKYKEALAKLREVDSIPNRTAHENYVLEQMRASAAMQAGDIAQAAKATQALISTGRLSSADQGRYAAGLASLYYRERDYAAAAQWAQRAYAANGDKAMRGLMIQSYYLSGNTAAAAREALEDVQAAERAGVAPPEDRLQLLANIASKGNDRQAYITSLERLVAYYPKREYWADLLRRIESKPGFNNRLALDVYRLKRATKTLDGGGNDQFEMAQLALQERQAAEAKKILEEGFAAGTLGKGNDAERQKRLLALAMQRAEEAPQQLATAEADALQQKDAEMLVRVGMGYSGLGQHDKAIQLIQQGTALLQQDKSAKGRSGRLDQANLHLGIAYLRAGNRQRAVQAFKAVGGNDGSADLARLWTKVNGA